MTRVRLPSTALKTPEINQEFFYFKLVFFCIRFFLRRMRRALVGALCGNERKRTRSSRSLGKMPAWAEIVFFESDDVLFF